jgi:Mg2+ and Co2+ transporter CorA
VNQNSASSSSLRATLYDAEGRDQQVALERSLIEKLQERQLLWVDLGSREEAAINAVQGVLELPGEVTELLASDEASARLLRFPDRVVIRLVAMQPVDRDSSPAEDARDVSSTPIDIIVARNVVVTVHDARVRAFEEFQDHIRGDSSLGALDAADFLTILVESVLAEYLKLVEGIERRIDDLDEVALRANQWQAFLTEVVALRRQVAGMRRALAPNQWAFAPLARPDFELEGLGKPWPGVVDRLDRAIDAVENARDLLMGAFDVYMARSAQRTNDVMKALTVLSAILLPAVVIGGVMGMNFRIGFFDNPNNFWLAVGAMAALAIGVVGVSRWRGWV